MATVTERVTGTCKDCGEALQGRSDKEFCDDSCRKRYARRPDATEAVEQPPTIPAATYPREVAKGVEERLCERHGKVYTAIHLPGWPVGFYTGECSECTLETKLRPQVDQLFVEQAQEYRQRVQKAVDAQQDELQAAVNAELQAQIDWLRQDIEQTKSAELRAYARETIEAEMRADIFEGLKRGRNGCDA